MADMGLGRSLLEIEPCRYGYSQLDCRGPEADLDRPYIAFLGATETVGPFLTRPFPYLVADALGMGCANLGVKNAGPDVFLGDPELLRVAQGAQAVVIEVMTAINLSNAFYKVHPRRNDRVIRSHPALYDLARGLDTTDIHFTGHLLKEVRRLSPEGAQTLVKTVQAAWIERMQSLVMAIGRPVHILRFVTEGAGQARLVEPLMLAALATMAASITRVTPSEAALSEGTEDMFFQPGEQHIAMEMLSATAHQEAAEILVDILAADLETARAG
ncbi:MAG: DUF6473 family protein [Pseudomonadota bacterium]